MANRNPIVQPDIVYLETGRVGALSQRGVEGPPTLVGEILAPSTTQIDRGTKHRLYARYAVPFFWLVDPEGRWKRSSWGSDGYSLAARAWGDRPEGLPPFPDLGLIPAALWLSLVRSVRADLPQAQLTVAKTRSIFARMSWRHGR